VKTRARFAGTCLPAEAMHGCCAEASTRYKRFPASVTWKALLGSVVSLLFLAPSSPADVAHLYPRTAMGNGMDVIPSPSLQGVGVVLPVSPMLALDMDLTKLSRRNLLDRLRPVIGEDSDVYTCSWLQDSIRRRVCHVCIARGRTEVEVTTCRCAACFARSTGRMLHPLACVCAHARMQ